MCFWKIKKHEKEINGTSSDLMDKRIDTRKKVGVDRRGVKSYLLI